LFLFVFLLVFFVASHYHGWVLLLLDLQQKLSMQVSVYTGLYPL
jgi:hypothetical protein